MWNRLRKSSDKPLKVVESESESEEDESETPEERGILFVKDTHPYFCYICCSWY